MKERHRRELRVLADTRDAIPGKIRGGAPGQKSGVDRIILGCARAHALRGQRGAVPAKRKRRVRSRDMPARGHSPNHAAPHGLRDLAQPTHRAAGWMPARVHATARRRIASQARPRERSPNGRARKKRAVQSRAAIEPVRSRLHSPCVPSPSRTRHPAYAPYKYPPPPAPATRLFACPTARTQTADLRFFTSLLNYIRTMPEIKLTYFDFRVSSHFASASLPLARACLRVSSSDPFPCAISESPGPR